MVAATIDNLRRQPGEQCLHALGAVDLVKLSFGLGTDNAIFERVVVWHKSIKLSDYEWMARNSRIN